MKTLRRTILACLLSLSASLLAAQEAGDTVYTFRFIAGKDMFYVPWQGNDKELSRLEACVEALKERILNGEIPVKVDGHCASMPTERENLAVAKVRSNRVKSELITRQGLTEDCFRTTNHSGNGDFVTVRIAVPQERQMTGLPLQKGNEEVKQQPVVVEGQATAESETVEQATTSEPPVTSVQTETKESVSHWYVGIRGGVPFAVSAYTAFAGDKTRAGWSAGIYGGYRFSPVLSLELQAAWGHANLASRSCCPDYWIGADGSLYEGAVANGTGWDWHDLKSRVSMQRYGVQLNVNVLGLFDKTKASRWTLEVSPLLAAYGTQADFQNMASGQTVYEGTTHWHLGVGGNLQAGYRLSEHINIGIYSGVVHLTGKPLDGTPSHLHKANFIWESGLKIGWNFGKQGKEGKR